MLLKKLILNGPYVYTNLSALRHLLYFHMLYHVICSLRHFEIWSSPKMIKMAILLNIKKNKTNLIYGENYSKKHYICNRRNSNKIVIYTEQIDEDSNKYCL